MVKFGILALRISFINQFFCLSTQVSGIWIQAALLSQNLCTQVLLCEWLLENGRHILLLRIVDPSYCLKMVDPSYCLRMVDRSYCLKMVDPSYCLRMVDTSCCLRMVDPSYCLRIVDTFNCLRMLYATLKWANFVFNTFLEPCPGGGYITPPYCTHGGGGGVE